MKTLGLLIVSISISTTLAQSLQRQKHADLEVSRTLWRGARELMNMTQDVMYDTDRRIRKLAFIKLNSIHTAPFETGYLTQVLQEKYRQMVDRYNLTMTMKYRLYNVEIILLLEDVERYFWEIDHICLVSCTPELQLALQPFQKKIIQEMSWPLRLYFLNEHRPATSTEATRRVGMEAWQMMPSRRQAITAAPTDDDDVNMKMKLFRLMYETVRDSDLKVKRAELIKAHYSNSSAFEIGYLMGVITDKFNVMTDISATLKRLYNEWIPLEHINAYEQIANQGIEINHIIELIRTANKKQMQAEQAELAKANATTLPTEGE